MSNAWHDMFFLQLPVLEKVLRPAIVYFLLLIGLRLAGKRELAQLNPFDLIVLLMLSNTVQNAIIGDDNSITGGAVGAAAPTAPPVTVLSSPMMAFCTVFDSMSRTIRSNGLSCANSRFPASRRPISRRK